MVERNSRCRDWRREIQSSSAWRSAPALCTEQRLMVAATHPRGLIVARTVPPLLGAPNLGKWPASNHLAVGSRGRSVLGDAQRLDLANHDCKYAMRGVSQCESVCAYRVHDQGSRCSVGWLSSCSRGAWVMIGMRQLAPAT
jgi:hypothetical protein